MQNPSTMASSSRLQSPPFLVNNDDLERSQARAARAASIRRRSTAFSPRPNLHRPKENPFLNHGQIMDLFQNCVKLARENKINQKNTWELGLIDHLSEIVRIRAKGEDNETNFQKASFTLETGVKIYALRVDSVHAEAYKVLGGINRAGYEADDANVGDGDHTHTEQMDRRSKKDLDRKLSPLTTLESSYEALNVKKIDVAFMVDPLYHQTSAQFDEGGAKGLLLNNLGVYGDCRVIFDSFESPEKTNLSPLHNDNAEVIDISFAKEIIVQMMIQMPVKYDISPTLRDILNQLDEDNCKPSDLFHNEKETMIEEDIDNNNNDHSEVEGNVSDDCGSLNFDHDDHGDNCTGTEANFTEYPEENGEYTIRDPNIDQRFENLADFLSLSLGFTSKSNAWAGPDHWKFQRVKRLEQNPCPENESEHASKKPKIKKEVVDLDFTKSLDKEMPNIIAPPKNPKSLLLKGTRGSCNITLPEDYHYKPESLVMLFLLPEVLCFGRKRRKYCDESREEDGSNSSPSWDDENTINDDSDFPAYSNSDAEEPGPLIRPKQQVKKVDIKYDKVSKQVDVHALKELLWSNIQKSVPISNTESEATVSLKQVLHRFSSDSCPIAASQNDISPHLFFICLLHLANEHNLSLHGRPTLDELDIHLPSSAIAK